MEKESFNASNRYSVIIIITDWRCYCLAITKIIGRSVYHSIASNLSSNFQISDYSTSQSKVLIPSKLPNSKDTLAFASSLKQSDSREPSTVLTATYIEIKRYSTVMEPLLM